MRAPAIGLLAAGVASGALAQGSPQTNSVGMQLVRIEPGTMQVGVYRPDCSNGATVNGMGAFGPANPQAGAAAGAGRAGAPAPAAGAAAGAGRAGAPPAAAGRGAPRDPRMAWSANDAEICAIYVKMDASEGFAVKLAKPFLISTTEVTQAQWKAVMGGRNPSRFSGDKVANPDRHPVDSVTWQDAQAFVRALNAKERTRAYRLPTEFEWEYACRAGGAGTQPAAEIRANGVIGMGLAAGGRGGAPATPQSTPETPAQYVARTGMTNEVATKPANAFGLHDMLGNVWEWVADPYNGKMFADPVPPRSGAQHVLKGGGFSSDIKNAICATHGAGPGDGFNVGFRVVRDVE